MAGRGGGPARAGSAGNKDESKRNSVEVDGAFNGRDPLSAGEKASAEASLSDSKYGAVFALGATERKGSDAKSLADEMRGSGKETRCPVKTCSVRVAGTGAADLTRALAKHCRASHVGHKWGEMEKLVLTSHGLHVCERCTIVECDSSSRHVCGRDGRSSQRDALLKAAAAAYDEKKGAAPGVASEDDYEDCPVDGCYEGFNFKDQRKGKNGLAVHCRRDHNGRKWTAQEVGVLQRRGLKVCNKGCGSVMSKKSNGHTCIRPEPAPARNDSQATLSQWERSGSKASFASVVGRKAGSPPAGAKSPLPVEAGSSGSARAAGSADHTGDTSPRGDQGLDRTDSVATQVLGHGVEGGADCKGLHAKLRLRKCTFKRLPRPVWPMWVHYIHTICAEYDEAKEKGVTGEMVDKLEELLDAPSDMLQRDGGIDAVKGRYMTWKRSKVVERVADQLGEETGNERKAGTGADGKDEEHERRSDAGTGMNGPVRPAAPPAIKGRGCYLVPEGLIQKSSNPQARRAQAILRAGAPKAMRKAATAATQSGIAEPSEQVYDALRPLHPARDQAVALPVCPATERDRVIVSEKDVTSIVYGYRGAAPGPSGWTADLLAPAIDSDAIRQSFASILTDIANGEFDGSPVGDRLRASVLVGLVKDEATKKLRPVTMGELFLKASAAAVALAEGGNVAEVLKVVQFGIGRSGGSEAASIVANTALAVNKRIGMVLLDQGNAYNQIPRDLVMRELYARPQLRRLWRIAAFAYGAPSPLLMYNRRGELVSQNVIFSEQGVRQGCALGGLLYAIAVQALYAEALAAAGEGLTGMVAVMDDVCVVGSLDAVRRVVAAFRTGSATRGLELNIDKCVVLQPEDPAVVSEWQRFAREQGFQKPHTGATQWLGTAVGWSRPEMIRIIKEINSEQHKRLFDIIKSADIGAQNALLLLRASALPRATYALRTAAPILVEDFTKSFDLDVAKALAAVVCRKEPTDGSSMFGPAGDSYRLSRTRGGLGLRSAQVLSSAAYLSAVAVAISYMTPEQRDVLKRQGSTMELGVRMAVTKLRIGMTRFLFAPSADPKNPVKAVECESTPQFVDHYTRTSAVGMPMQRLISAALERRAYNMLCDDSKTKARLLSAGDENAHVWLTTTPSEPIHRMADLEVVRALRHRIGIAPIDTRPLCACGTVLSDQNFDHLHNCHASDATTARHNVLQQALAAVAAEAGVASRMNYGTSGKAKPDGSRLNPDGVLLRLHSTGADVVVDVAVVNPTADSYTAKYPVAVKALDSAAHMEDLKHKKYREFLSTHKSVFCPFVAESYGAFGVCMKEIIAALARRANERTVPSAFGLQAFSYTQWANRALAAAVQRGNSAVVDVGLERMQRRRF